MSHCQHSRGLTTHADHPVHAITRKALIQLPFRIAYWLSTRLASLSPTLMSKIQAVCNICMTCSACVYLICWLHWCQCRLWCCGLCSFTGDWSTYVCCCCFCSRMVKNVSLVAHSGTLICPYIQIFGMLRRHLEVQYRSSKFEDLYRSSAWISNFSSHGAINDVSMDPTLHEDLMLWWHCNAMLSDYFLVQIWMQMYIMQSCKFVIDNVITLVITSLNKSTQQARTDDSLEQLQVAQKPSWMSA